MKIQALPEYIETAQKNLLAFFEGIDLEKVKVKADEDTWSMIEILEHIIAAEKKMQKALVLMLRGAGPRPQGDQQVYAPPSLLEGVSLEEGLEISVGAKTEPTNQGELVELLQTTEKLTKTTLGYLEKGDKLDLEKNRIPHHYFGELGFYDWVYFIGRHKTLHLEHAQRNWENLIGNS